VDNQSPDAIFDRRWALIILDRAQVRLREEYVQSGNAAVFDQLKVFHSGDRPDLSYAEAANVWV